MPATFANLQVHTGGYLYYYPSSRSMNVLRRDSNFCQPYVSTYRWVAHYVRNGGLKLEPDGSMKVISWCWPIWHDVCAHVPTKLLPPPLLHTALLLLLGISLLLKAKNDFLFHYLIARCSSAVGICLIFF